MEALSLHGRNGNDEPIVYVTIWRKLSSVTKKMKVKMVYNEDEC